MRNETNEMYQAVYAKDGSLKHSHECKMNFGRKDTKCHRCVEMLNGSSPREGWQKKHYTLKKFSHAQAMRV